MTAAILFAFASAAFLGAAVVTSQLGLRTIDPLSGAAVSVPAFTLLFLLLSPILLFLFLIPQIVLDRRESGATLAWVAWRLPETARALNRHATAPGPLLAQWRLIGRDRVFVAWTALISATYGGLFVILAGSSYVYIGTLGLTPLAYGVAIGSTSAAYMVGTFVCRRWVARLGVNGAVRRAGWFTLAGGASIVALAAAGVSTVWAVLLPQWLFTFAHGVHQPCGQTGAVGPFPKSAGAAAALAGFVLAATAFFVGLWLGRALDGTTWPFALGVGLCALATTTIAWTLVQRLPPTH